MSANPLSTVSLMLTLASLTGSFFYIQLSQWLRDILALRQKVELNKRQGDEAQKRAIVECRIEHAKLANMPTLIVNLLVIAFVVFVIAIALLMVGFADGDPLQPYIRTALWVFLILFVGLSGWLLFLGQRNAAEVKRLIESSASQ